MGIVIELCVLALVLALAVWQWHDLRRARGERLARERRPQGSTPPSQSPEAEGRPAD